MLTMLIAREEHGEKRQLRLPRWVIGLLFAILSFAVDFIFPQSDVAEVASGVLLAGIFLAGAIQRLNWRHMLVLGGLLLVGLGAKWLVEHSDWPAELPIAVHWLIVPVLLGWLLGIGEMCTTSRWSWRLAGALLLVATSVAALRIIITTMLSGTEWVWHYDLELGSWWVGGIFPVSTLMYWPLSAVFVWWGVTAALNIARRGPRARVIGAGVLVAVVGFYCLFMSHLIYGIAQRSIEGRGPFTRGRGVMWLAHRGQHDDLECILDQLCQANWDEPLKREIFRSDWRMVAVQAILEREDFAPRAAEAFSEALRRDRSKPLANCVAELMADQHRLEIVPIFLRYALKPDLEGGSCADALEKMGVREVGIAILRYANLFEGGPDGADFPLRANDRQRMAALLGVDVGDSYNAWLDAWIYAVDETPSPLPPAVQEEIDRELRCYTNYCRALGRWQQARAITVRQRMAEGGVDLGTCFQTTTEEMAISEPDWDAPTIEAFEVEIKAYCERVEALIRRYAEAERAG